MNGLFKRLANKLTIECIVVDKLGSKRMNQGASIDMNEVVNELFELLPNKLTSECVEESVNVSSKLSEERRVWKVARKLPVNGLTG